jgi:hypothetical protein
VSKRSTGYTSLLGANVRKVVRDDAHGVDSFLMRGETIFGSQRLFEENDRLQGTLLVPSRD